MLISIMLSHMLHTFTTPMQNKVGNNIVAFSLLSMQQSRIPINASHTCGMRLIDLSVACTNRRFTIVQQWRPIISHLGLSFQAKRGTFKEGFRLSERSERLGLSLQESQRLLWEIGPKGLSCARVGNQQEPSQNQCNEGKLFPKYLRCVQFN